MEHIIITRCKFSDDKLFDRYFSIMKKYYIPSINNQTDKNFKIALIVTDRHYDRIRELIDKKIEIIKLSNPKKDYKDYVVKNNVTIQTRHDCDDFMDKRYIEFIHKKYNENKDKFEDFIITFQPNKINDNNSKEYTHSRDYSKVCSMFSTLVQKKVNHGIMDVMHDNLVRLTKNVIYIPETYVKLVIHGNNTISKLNENDKIIEKIKV